MVKLRLPGKFRLDFPFTKHTVFLNAAAFGPICLSIKKQLDRFDRSLLEMDNWTFDLETFRLLDECRKLVSKMINTRPEYVGFGYNTSFGLNICANGLPLCQNDEVLLTDNDFPANVYVWQNLRRRGIKITYLPAPGGFLALDTLKKTIGSRTRVVALSFVQYQNGYKNDLEAIGAICREYGLWFIVDGTQGIGAETIDFEKSQIDFLSCGGQKWLCYAPGTGFFSVSKRLFGKLRPIFSSWLGVDWHLDFTDLQKKNLLPFPDARRFEIGTYPARLVRHFHAALSLLLEIGIQNIQRHNHKLLDVLIDYLQDSPYQIKSVLDEKHRSSILVFTGENVPRLMRQFRRHRIWVAEREDGIRVAPHFYNALEDIEKLIGVLKQSEGK